MYASYFIIDQTNLKSNEQNWKNDNFLEQI